MSEMKARVLDVGNCDSDHSRIRRLLEANFDLAVDRVMFVDQALAALAENAYHLVLVNRLIFADGSDGGELIRRMQAEGHANTPVMMISDYPQAQEKAVAQGAVPGFGKADLEDPQTIERLSRHLPH
jgi:two-component system chemotaxis response regulator CheY